MSYKHMQRTDHRGGVLDEGLNKIHLDPPENGGEREGRGEERKRGRGEGKGDAASQRACECIG